METPKEKVYMTAIKPLINQIYQICKENDIDFVTLFEADYYPDRGVCKVLGSGRSGPDTHPLISDPLRYSTAHGEGTIKVTKEHSDAA